MIFLIFLLCALAAAAGYALLAPALTVGGALLAFALGWLGANLLYLLLIIVYSLCLPRIAPEESVDEPRPLARWLLRSGARFLGGYAGVRVHMSGMEKLPKEPFLLVSNHRSLFDPILTIGWLPAERFAMISKPSNMRIPFAGRILQYSGCLGIDRENDRAALKTILRAADYLKRGVCSMGIYPEGTRNRTDEPLLPFHAGSFKIAQKANAPVVVLCMRGTEKVAKSLLTLRTPVYMDLLEVIEPARAKAMKSVELADCARRLIEAKLKEDM